MQTAFIRSNLLKWTLAGTLVFSLPFARRVAGQQSSSETIAVDAQAGGHPFPHFWEQMFGSGRAVLSLREDYRRDLRRTRESTELKYVRFHAIFHDENGVYNEDAQGRPVYNWSYVDQIYDGLLLNNVKPFVELSFMPGKLAANPKPHPFWYKPLPSPPRDPQKWAALIEAFTRHLVERYGESEVEQWYFEVWNEPNIDFWDGEPQQATYFAFYDVTAQAVKKVDSKLKIGGPATAQAAWVDAFLAHCLQNHVPFDYVSTHVYGNDTTMDVFGKKMPMLRRDMVAASAKKVYDQVKASGAPDTPIIWSEYNATYMNQTEVTDSAFMGPWLANNIRECDGLTNMMSYWTFSDVFEEQGPVKTPFYGGYGLVAERGIPKAVFRAFELLHQLGSERLASVSENALVTRTKEGKLVIALWNYAEPDQLSAPPRTFHLQLTGAVATRYRIQLLDPDHGSPMKAWQRMGSPALPTFKQVQDLQQASTLPDPAEHNLSDSIVVPAQGLALVQVE